MSEQRYKLTVIILALAVLVQSFNAYIQYLTIQTLIERITILEHK